ncbi:MAG: hypothetical protein G01um10143_647 [Parcubacteria group bacterium Gr01-1014_3]|nr:MAG: hypothetical protein G01um10143_647 [Parcubacteria group bacterium Gr01-1014_3]
MNAKRLIMGAIAVIGLALSSIGIYGYITHDKVLADNVGVLTGLVIMMLVAMYWPKVEKQACGDCGFEHCKCNPPAKEGKPAEEKKDEKC